MTIEKCDCKIKTSGVKTGSKNVEGPFAWLIPFLINCPIA
jgi:hypothetical protein